MRRDDDVVEPVEPVSPAADDDKPIEKWRERLQEAVQIAEIIALYHWFARFNIGAITLRWR